MAPNSARTLLNSSNATTTITPKSITNICCIGAGYVGGLTCAVIAHQVPGTRCTVLDLNTERIAAWNSNHLPIDEPKLDEIVKLVRDGVVGKRSPNLFFTNEATSAIANADIIFICVGTPTKTTGLGAGRAIDLSYIESAARLIAANVKGGYKIVVEKSTVPCRTADIIADILSANTSPSFLFDILSNPEFLAEGTAVDNLLYPDRILIGTLLGQYSSKYAADYLTDLYAAWVPRDRIISMNLWSSEMAKIAANAMLAQRISSINSLSAICEATNASIDEVSYAIGLDKRIGPHMLKSSVGFGGSCFKKDVLSLVYLAECLELPEVSEYWRSVIEINRWQKNRFTRRIVKALHGSLSGKRIAVLGFAYKKDTGDTRESASISVVNNLIAERATVAIYDPKVRKEHIWLELEASDLHSSQSIGEQVLVYRSAYEACHDAHAIVIMTDWEEFRTYSRTTSRKGTQSRTTTGDEAQIAGKSLVHLHRSHDFGLADTKLDSPEPSNNLEKAVTLEYANTYQDSDAKLDWNRIAEIMKRPSFVFDGRNIVNPKNLEDLGFRVECIGKSRPYGRTSI